MFKSFVKLEQEDNTKDVIKYGTRSYSKYVGIDEKCESQFYGIFCVSRKLQLPHICFPIHVISMYKRDEHG